jgi:hypothetical protein
MARGKTIATGTTSFVGAPDIGGVPLMKGTGTKIAIGFFGAAGATSGTVTMIGDIQKAGGTPPTGSSYGTATPLTDVIREAFLIKTAAPATPVDVTDKATITGDNTVKLTGITAANASNAYLFVVFDESDKMGAKR